jgi:Ca-activated chloride channel family protein
MLDLPFARPSFLYLLIFVLVMGIISIVASKRRRQRLQTFGRPETVLGLSTLRPKSRRRSRILLFIALIGLVAAVSGPRWGKGNNEGVIVGRDLVIVLDLSRSMIARDMADGDRPERWQAAKFATQELIETVRQRGGHRLGIVVFAARSHVICPLTSDYDHVRSRLDEFSPHAPPPEVRPDPDEPLPTGTSIGAAIHTAIGTHDPRFPGYQDILLFSDGDGPEVEQEIELSIRESVERQIPVHVVGLGNPKEKWFLEFGEGQNTHLVGTMLQEGILKDLARRTKGEYYAAQREIPQLGPWFTQIIEPRPSRELSDDALPQPRDRSMWFMLGGLVFLTLAWIREP